VDAKGLRVRWEAEHLLKREAWRRLCRGTGMSPDPDPDADDADGGWVFGLGGSGAGAWLGGMAAGLLVGFALARRWPGPEAGGAGGAGAEAAAAAAAAGATRRLEEALLAARAQSQRPPPTLRAPPPMLQGAGAPPALDCHQQLEASRRAAGPVAQVLGALSAAVVFACLFLPLCRRSKADSARSAVPRLVLALAVPALVDCLLAVAVQRFRASNKWQLLGNALCLVYALLYAVRHYTSARRSKAKGR
jgi:hypothetical protein